MALRTRPLKFNIWQVTRLQKRSCRSQLQPRFGDHGSLQRERVMPYGLNECRTCSLKVNQKKPTTEKTGEGDKQNVLVPFYYRDIQLQPWIGQSLGNDGVTIKLSHHIDQDVNLCDTKPENHIACAPHNACWTGNGQCFWPYIYTSDDILCGRHNTLVNSATLQVDPSFVNKFFKSQKPTPSVNTEHCVYAKQELKLQPIAISPPVTTPFSEPSDSGSNSLGASDFVNFIEYFMTGAYSLEKAEDVPYCPSPVPEDVPYCPSPVPEDRLGSWHVSSSSVSDTCNSNLPGVMYYGDIQSQSEGSKKKKPTGEKPTLEQLNTMQNYLAETLPKVFVSRHEYRVYTQDVIFENNLFEKTYGTIGINNYAMQVAKLRIMAHFRFANVKVHILKITVHEEDGSVRVRWRLSGIPQQRAFMFWKFLPWRYSEKVDKESEWHDGFSTFYLNTKGMIAKHRMDKVIPEEEVLAKKDPSIAETILA